MNILENPLLTRAVTGVKNSPTCHFDAVCLHFEIMGQDGTAPEVAGLDILHAVLINKNKQIINRD